MYQNKNYAIVFGTLLALGWVKSTQAIDTQGLESAMTEWAGDRSGAIVALTIDGDKNEFVAAGKWSDSDDRLADENSAFEIGSITKVFTSLLAADAVGAGAMGWDEPVGSPFAASVISYAQLSTHTSGLPRLPGDFSGTGLTDPYVGIERSALVTSFAKEVLVMEDEAHGWAYSNFGPSVLGAAVATALDGEYAELLRTRVLARLGMSHTWLSGLEAGKGVDVAPGHNAEGVASAWRFDAYAPAGALVSSANDMKRFMVKLLDPAAAGLPESWAETMTPRAKLPTEGEMGYGWFISEVSGHPVYWHGGGTGGYRSFVGIQPATGRGITVMGARDKAVEGIGLGWLQGLLDKRSEVEVEGLADLNDYVGDYPLMPSFVIAITVVDGKLHLQATRQPRLGLKAAGEDEFTLEGVTAAVTFKRDESGEVSGMVLHQNGADRPAKRFPLGSQQPERTNLELSAEQLDPLEGVYALAPTFKITVSRQGTMLFAQATGQPKFPVFASAPNVFFYEVVEAEIHFQRNAAGEVTGLVLHQGGRELPGLKE